ncbi:bactofilin family protein [Saccharospirillum impatiens]|uniref:bactofilin family protein n=1 Tax=Saccharospirillum impatiens TaxID=169438 RepID=UPI000400B92E|nr:polymer-forming cytoskeletal protein [Saccharospirillum impatiens]
MWGSKQTVANDVTLISVKAEISGDIRVSGGLHVDGRIKGNILADPDSGAAVRISDKGYVEGEIRAPNIVINGEVKGDVYSSEHIELAKKAVVTGDVHYVMMEMVMGAKVNGKLLHVAAEKGKKVSKPEPVDAKPVTEAPMLDAGKPVNKSS